MPEMFAPTAGLRGAPSGAFALEKVLPPEVLARSHFHEPRLGPLKFESQALTGIKLMNINLGRHNQLNTAVIEFIHQTDESASTVVRLFTNTGTPLRNTVRYSFASST